MKISGVYKIANTITGDFYIGSSKDIKRRWAKHKSPSTWAYCPNSRLYQDMAQYGIENFILEIIEETVNLKEREQYYIEQLKPSYNNYRAKGQDAEGYNKRSKSYYQAHKEEHSAYYKDWYEDHREEYLAKSKANDNRLCLYKGETLTLRALRKRFCKQGIAHPTFEAKKYLI